MLGGVWSASCLSSHRRFEQPQFRSAHQIQFSRQVSSLNVALLSSVLSPQSWPFDLKWLPQSAYLVGGCVRDALLDHPSPYLDLDFVLPDAPIEVARSIAQCYRAGFVVLDAERQIARVVFDQATVDLALQVGNSIEEDLSRRDYTVNAIAYSPHTQTLFDPLRGQRDLERRRMRMVSPENLREDPLRLLRGYRQAAQLNFTLEENTRAHIRQLAPLITTVAAERVRAELTYLLNSPTGSFWLQQLYQDGLLHSIFPEVTESGLAWLAAMDEATEMLAQRWPQLIPNLYGTLSDRAKGGEGLRRTSLSTAKLVGLVAQEPSRAKEEMQRLKYSRTEINWVSGLLMGMAQCRTYLAEGGGRLQPRHQYWLCQTLAESVPVFVAIASANGIPFTSLIPLLQEYLNPRSVIAHPKPLVTGQTLMQTFQLQPGPLIGELLTMLALAQVDGKVSTAREALSYVEGKLHAKG
jgi:tRNA nucleotidyltransferase (CCA-adding enzyme)